MSTATSISIKEYSKFVKEDFYQHKEQRNIEICRIICGLISSLSIFYTDYLSPDPLEVASKASDYIYWLVLLSLADDRFSYLIDSPDRVLDSGSIVEPIKQPQILTLIRVSEILSRNTNWKSDYIVQISNIVYTHTCQIRNITNLSISDLIRINHNKKLLQKPSN